MENNKKRKKRKKEKKEIVYRTRDERRNEVKTIITQLTEFDLNAKYQPVRDFFKLCKNSIFTDYEEAVIYFSIIISIYTSFLKILL